MEDIIQFLIIIGALFIGFASQNKRKNRQSTEEVFPPIFDYENEEPKEEEKNPQTAAPYTSPMFSSAAISQETSIDQAILRSQASSPRSSRQNTGRHPDPKKNEASRINLRSPQKARDAFIYSEIFTRKYE